MLRRRSWRGSLSIPLPPLRGLNAERAERIARAFVVRFRPEDSPEDPDSLFMAALAGKCLAEDKVCLDVGWVERHCLAGSTLRFDVVAEPVVCSSEIGKRAQPRTHVIVPCTRESHIELGDCIV